MTARKPEEFVDMLGAMSRTLRARAAQAYAELGLGNTQAKFLRHLGRHERMSQAELARATVTDPTLTGRVLQTLIDRGWVRRTRSQEDRRQYVLELTASGQRARAKVDQARTEVARALDTVLDARDLEDFERVAKKILAAFERQDGAR